MPSSGARANSAAQWLDNGWPYQVASITLGNALTVAHDFCESLSLAPRKHTSPRSQLKFER
jgi:hypothetical protein